MAECALRRRERCREKGWHVKPSSGMPATGMILQSDRLIGCLPEDGITTGQWSDKGFMTAGKNG